MNRRESNVCHTSLHQGPMNRRRDSLYAHVANNKPQKNPSVSVQETASPLLLKFGKYQPCSFWTFQTMAVPNPAPHNEDDRAYILCIIVSITLALDLALICCRFYVRIKLTKNLGWDDVLIVLAAVCKPNALAFLSPSHEQLTGSQGYRHSRSRHDKHFHVPRPRQTRFQPLTDADPPSGQMGLRPIGSSGPGSHVHQRSPSSSSSAACS